MKVAWACQMSVVLSWQYIIIRSSIHKCMAKTAPDPYDYWRMWIHGEGDDPCHVWATEEMLFNYLYIANVSTHTHQMLDLSLWICACMHGRCLYCACTHVHDYINHAVWSIQCHQCWGHPVKWYWSKRTATVHPTTSANYQSFTHFILHRELIFEGLWTVCISCTW